jgi:hemerythrin-like domain-containing protein
MKRSQTLIKLSREHHAALVLARRAKKSAPGSDAVVQLMADFQARWNEGLVPHFAEEEATLLPRIVAAGANPFAERLRADHDRLRELAAHIIAGRADVLTEFGNLLSNHVHFEEHELFPFYEALVGEYQETQTD